MKTKIILTVISIGLLFFNSCDRLKTETFSSFIISYGETEKALLNLTENGNISIRIKTIEVCGYKSTGDKKIKYNELCEKNKDITYNKKLSYFSTPFETGEVARNVLNNLASINVTSDANFDEHHHAGSSLNDIIQFAGMSFSNFINNNYKNNYDWNANSVPQIYKIENIPYLKTTITPVYKLLSNMKKEDFVLCTDLSYIFFTKKPSLAKVHNFKIKIVLDNGKSIPTYALDNNGNELDFLKITFD